MSPIELRGCMYKIGGIEPHVAVIVEASVILSGIKVIAKLIDVVVIPILLPAVGLVVVLVVEVAVEEIMRSC